MANLGSRSWKGMVFLWALWVSVSTGSVTVEQKAPVVVRETASCIYQLGDDVWFDSTNKIVEAGKSDKEFIATGFGFITWTFGGWRVLYVYIGYLPVVIAGWQWTF